jgi:YebC/PmpR family DNA-binding regulatory protein
MGRHFEVRAAAMAKTAAAKAKVYSRYSKEILVAAKNGDPNPDMNQTLKKAIERAKANSVPSDVIKRAIEKAKSSADENYSEARYEGFGQGAGSTVIIDCLTDNNNRTIANLRACFNKSHSKLGVAGSASFGYEHLGVIVIEYDDEEAMMEAMIENEIDLRDIEIEDGYMTITTDPNQLDEAKEVVDKLIPGVKYEVMEAKMVPNDEVTLEGEDLELFKRLLTLLDEVDDVQNVYHNVANID